MQATTFLLIAGISLALVPASAAAASADVIFDSPAQLQAAQVTTTGTWALLIFSPGDEAQFHGIVNLQGSTNHTFVKTAVKVNGGPEYHGLQPLQDQPLNQVGQRQLTLQMVEGTKWKSIYIEADSIQFNGSLWGQIALTGPDPARAVDPVWPSGTIRYGVHQASGVDLTNSHAGQGSTWALQVQGLHMLEWHNATVACDVACPDGAQSSEISSTGPIQESTESFIEARMSAGTMRAEGQSSWVAIGATTLATAIHGDIRLPNLKCTQACQIEPGKTLRISGNVTLDNLRAAPSGHSLETAPTGVTGSVLLDETPSNLPSILGYSAVAVTTTAVVGLLIVKLLGVLATRLRKPDALSSPKRQLIYDYVLQYPGTAVRPLLRATNLTSGTGRHHLAILLRSGLLKAMPSGKTLRIFVAEEHAPDKWPEYSLRREQHPSALLDLIGQRPGITQTELSLGIQANTSLAQYHLGRLAEAGLVEIRLDGRRRRYYPSSPGPYPA